MTKSRSEDESQEVPQESKGLVRFGTFPFQQAGKLCAEIVEQIYDAGQFHPLHGPGSEGNPELASLPETGQGFDGFAAILQKISRESSMLATPTMMGHMDTAPHPAAAFSDALVSALNNNLLFRELSPFASEVEEFLLQEVGLRLGLDETWAGTFTSGGSLANLTALFAAVGGFSATVPRDQCAFFVPACAHVSVQKAAAVLGIPADAVHVVESDEQGRAELSSLQIAIDESPASVKVVVAVIGSTVHGAVEDVNAIAKICAASNVWLHVDAIYGGALAFSFRHRAMLAGLDLADSVVCGPQKWMYVPRLSAMLWVKGKRRFTEALEFGNSYSQQADFEHKPHRGKWGLQGSRRADALTLWVVLNYVGTDALGQQVDAGINTTGLFFKMLDEHPKLQPMHQPDLNLQCFGYRNDIGIAQLQQRHASLGSGSLPWVSLTHWQGKDLFRAVLLSPETGELEMQRLLEYLE